MLNARALAVMLGLSALPGLADAAAMGSLGPTIGLFAALASVLALQVAPLAPAALWPSAAVLFLLALAGVMLWRRRPALHRAFGALAGSSHRDLDRVEFLVTARRQFVELQAAWDGADLVRLGSLTTADMLDELRATLPERGAGPNRTDVLELHAELLAFEHMAALDVASVEFSGLIRESAHLGAVPFRELWMLARIREEGRPWLLARQLALL